LDAFVVRQSNTIDLASTLDLLGCIQLALFDTEAAINNFQEALELRLNYWRRINPYHPDIGTSYHNLGKIDTKTRNYKNAEMNYSRASEIDHHNYSQIHPLVREITNCLKEIQRQLKC